MRKIFSVLSELANIILLILVGNTVAFGYYWTAGICLILAGLFAGLSDEFV